METGDQATQITHGVASYLPVGERRPITVMAAWYADEAHLSVIARTRERGEIAASREDAPDTWQQIHAQVMPEPFVVSIAEEKAALCDAIDTRAAALRKKFLPQDPGIEWVYREKAEEATRYLGKLALNVPAEELTAETFPFLARSIPFDGDTLGEVANVVWSRHQAGKIALADLEAKRRANKAAITSAETVADVRAAFQAATWQD